MGFSQNTVENSNKIIGQKLQGREIDRNPESCQLVGPYIGL
jgi:hypothetical protein